MKPLIGIVGNYLDKPIPEHANLPVTYTPQGYVDAVHAAGGIPVVIPIVNTDNITSLLNHVDGIVLAGGQDIDPIFYGEEPHIKLGSLNYPRDVFELSLLRKAVVKNIPVLGICRGIQVINVALGGSLYQDLSEYSNWKIKHQQYGTAWQTSTHSIKITSNNVIHDIFGDTACVNSLHHQAICKLAPSLHPLAYSADNLIEAVDSPNYRILGVQWHPEAQYKNNAEALQIFKWLISEAQK